MGLRYERFGLKIKNMGCCDNVNDNSHRVIEYWAEFLATNKKTLTEMAEYFRITEDEARSILENHPELKLHNGTGTNKI